MRKWDRREREEGGEGKRKRKEGEGREGGREEGGEEEKGGKGHRDDIVVGNLALW